MGRLLTIAALSIAAVAVASPALGQESTDPEASSPAGAIYEIPIDTARRDGAPRRGRDGGQGSAGNRSGARGDSPIKSENNFGSSSHVPGLPGGGSGGGDSGGGDGAGERDSSGGGGGSDDSGDGPGAAAGGAAGSGGPAGSAGDVAPASTLSPGGVSTLGAFGLAALVLLLGGYVGLLAARGARRRTGH